MARIRKALKTAGFVALATFAGFIEYRACVDVGRKAEQETPSEAAAVAAALDREVARSLKGSGSQPLR